VVIFLINNGKNDMRIFILNLLMILGGVILIIRLFDLQIVNGADYRKKAENRSSKQVTVVAPRGEILDRHGDILATNRDGYNVLMYKQTMTTDERNLVILNLVNLLIDNNVTYRDTFPIKLEKDKADFLFDTDEELAKWKKKYKIASNLTAMETLEEFRSKYKLEKYTLEDSRKIIGIKYELDRVGYSAFKPYEVATDINKEVVAILEERFNEFPGVKVEIQPIRVYPNENLASHILGYISKISSEKYEELKDEGYSANDNIGRSGIESTMERFLRGENSLQKMEVSANGKITYYKNEETKTGAQVYLTIDSQLQKVAEKALKNTIRDIANGKYSDGSYEAKSGAVVAIDVKSGEILAMASYPDYDPNVFVKGLSNEEWSKLNVETKPMFNRNIMGLYSPGSIFKMVVAVAALEEKKITPNTIIVDEGVYTKYKSPQPKCWIWSSGRTHGPVNVSDAIKTSCNYFFYSVGEMVGIDKIEEYSRKFGLGEKTGIELEGEKTGIVASRKYVEKKENREWKIGETLSAAIGQSYHSFTPIQIARYIAILANGGKRVSPHIIKNVITNDGTILGRDVIEAYLGNELGFDYYNDDMPEDLNISQTTLKAVFSGMESVTGDASGTAYNTFKNFPVKVGGKTGSVQVSGSKADNAWFIGFAPYDDPEIAICALVEHGVHGAYTASIVLEILKEYFGLKETGDNINTQAIVSDNTMM
jgi:penicillin-binding protein 2